MKISVQTVLDLLHSIMHPLSPELVHHLQRTGLICWYLGNWRRKERYPAVFIFIDEAIRWMRYMHCEVGSPKYSIRVVSLWG